MNDQNIRELAGVINGKTKSERKSKTSDKTAKKQCPYKKIGDPVNCYYYGCLLALNGQCCIK